MNQVEHTLPWLKSPQADCDEQSAGSVAVRRRLSSTAMVIVMMAAVPVAGAIQPEPESDEVATFIRQDLTALDGLQQARDWTASGQFERAARKYQQLLEEHPSALVLIPSSTAPSSRASNAEMERFGSMREVVARDLAAAPDDLRNRYSALFDAAAQLNAVQVDPASVDAVSMALKYPLSSASIEVLEATAESRLESAEFDAAVDILDTLIGLNPNHQRMVYWQAKRALCRHFRGDRSAMAEMLVELRGKEDPTVTWGGRSQRLSEFLTSVQERSASAAAQTIPRAIEPQARLWQYRDSQGEMLTFNDDRDTPSAESDDEKRAAILQGDQLTTVALAHRGMIYCADRYTLTAIDPQSSDIAAWRVSTAVGTKNDSDRWLSTEQAPSLHDVSAAGDHIIVHLERPDVAEKLPNTSTLICVNAANGEVLWRNDLTDIATEFDECRLDGAPIPVGNRLIGVARRRKAFGFEACVAVCFDLESGRTLWQTSLGEASTGGYGYHRATRTRPMLVGGNAIIASNMGTIASIDVGSGTIRWLVRYSPAQSQRGRRLWNERDADRVRSWSYNTPLKWRDMAAIAALDRNDVVLLKLSDGSLQRTIESESLKAPQSILGIDGDTLLACDQWVVAYNLDQSRIAWERQITNGRLLGRGTINNGFAYVPTSAALMRYALADGDVQSFDWPIERAGNLSADGDQIIVAAGELTYGLVEKDRALAVLQKRMEERSDDPAPAIAMAQLAMEIDDHSRALDAFDLALARASDAQGELDDRFAERLFRLAMRFAESLARNATAPDDAGRLVTATALLQRAGRCRPEPEGMVRLSFALADVERRRGHPADAIEQYQSVLDDSERAEVSLSTGSEGPATAGGFAASQIDELITRYDRNIYEGIEQRAAAALLDAAEGRNIPKLIQVADHFPNARSAQAALEKAADLLLLNGDVDAAVSVLRIELRFCSVAERLETIARIANILAEHDKSDSALGWITLALNQTRRDAVPSQLRQAATLTTPNDASDLNVMLTLPLRQRFSVAIKPDAMILEPTADRLLNRNWNHVLLLDSDGLSRIDASTGQSMWQSPMADSPRPSLIAQFTDVALLATQTRLFACDMNDGTTKWSLGEGDKALRHPDVDPEWVPRWSRITIGGERIIASTDHGELTAMRLSDGKLEWRIKTSPRIGGVMVADQDWIAYSAWQDRRNVVVLINPVDGNVTARVAIATERPMHSLRALPDGRLLAATSTTIHCIDPRRGQVVWNRPVAGRIISDSLVATLDGILLTENGSHISCFDGETGRLKWRSHAIAGADNLSIMIRPRPQGLFAITDRNCALLEPITGAVLWESPQLATSDLFPPYLQDGTILFASPVVTEVPAGPAPLPEPVSLHSFPLNHSAIPASSPVSNMVDANSPANGQATIIESIAALQIAIRRDLLLIRTAERLEGWRSDRAGQSVPPH